MASGDVYPSAGTITVTLPSGTLHIFYRADQSVDIDADGDGAVDATFSNCLDPRLLMCVA